jgi:hypothetical protein
LQCSGFGDARGPDKRGAPDIAAESVELTAGNVVNYSVVCGDGVFLAYGVEDGLEQSFDIARDFTGPAGGEINEARGAFEHAAQKHFELAVVGHARYLEMEFLIGLDEGVEAAGAAGSSAGFPVILLERFDFGRLGAENGELGGNAFKQNASFEQVTDGSKAELGHEVTAARYDFEKLLVVEPVASFAEWRTANGMAGLNRGLGQETAFGEFSVEDAVLKEAVGAIDQSAGGLLFLSKTRHAAIY